jgi:hypothetical protein
MKKIVLISITSLLSTTGFACLFEQGGLLTTIYVAATSVLLLTVAVGGVLQYFSQEHRDLRDMYREMYAVQKQQINELKQQLNEKVGTSTTSKGKRRDGIPCCLIE